MRTQQRRPTRLRVERLEDRAVPATFYVATNGSNSAAGGSTTPWRTLQHAAGEVSAGDTVIVRAGNYDGFYLDTSGTSTARITFSAEAGVNVTTENPTTPDGINLEGADYVTIQGFNVTGMERTGIRTVLNTGVIIRNNNCDQNGKWGILTGFSNDLLIENNVCTRSAIEHGIYVSNSGDRPTIRGNTCWGNRANGIHMNGDFESQPGDGIISNALVENNIIYDNGLGGGSGINCDGVQNSVFRNNLIYNAHASGISLYRIDGGGSSTGNLLVNNTVLLASDGRWALNIANGSTGNTVRNNVFYSAQSFRGAISITADSLAGFTSNYNIVEDRFSIDGGNTAINLAQWLNATPHDDNSLITSNPSTLFVNAAGGNYHLADGSAAINAGTSSNAPPTDYEGTARPSGGGYDIGHDEFAATSPPPPPPPPPSAKPFAVGSGPGEVATVTMYNADQTVRFTAQPFGSTYTGGVRVALGDVTGDGIVDIVAVTNGGIVARARIVDGNTGAILPQQLLAGTGYTGAVSVAVGDITGDGIDEIAVGTNENGPRARTFRGGNFLKLSDFRAGVAANFQGRTSVALGDMTGDGKAELVVSSLYSNGSRIAGYRGGSLAPGRKPVKAFTPFVLGGGYVDGLHLAVGDVNADGVADLILGSGFGTAAANVDVYSGQPLVDSNIRTRIANFTPAQSSSTTGVRVAVRDADGDGQLDILTSSGEMVSGFKGGSGLPATGLPPELFAFDPDPNTSEGVWVG